MYTKQSRWTASLKRWFSGLYLVSAAFSFIGIGTISLLLPLLQGTVWQTIGAALLGSGLTILVTAITARQSSNEQYKKEANLQRKTDIYGPLHSELKALRETFDKAHAGKGPYPWWIDVGSEMRPKVLQYVNYTAPMFSLWPQFRNDYRIDNFTPDAQKLLNDVYRLAIDYNHAVEATRELLQTVLRKHIAASIRKEEKRKDYQEWQRKRHESPYISNRWFEFIDLQMSTTAPTVPLGAGLSQSWTRTVGWLFGEKADQAAQDIYGSDATNWGAPDLIQHSWFQAIFQAAFGEIKSTSAYQDTLAVQKQLFLRLQEAEKTLYQGLLSIRDRYEGGTPPV